MLPGEKTRWPKGRVETVLQQSQVLAGNFWNDPVARELKIYLPPGYDQADQTYPVIWYLAAYTNSGASVSNWRGFSENLAQRMDRLIADQKIQPMVVVAPDCFGALGGSQYLNSPSVGQHFDYIHDELLGLVEDRYRVKRTSQHRAVMGKSSGGFAAIRFAMSRPDIWGAFASHAGDAGFDWVYLPDFPKAAARLQRFDGDAEAFIRWFWQANAPGGDDFHTLMLLCLAATYDPEPTSKAGLVLPFNQYTLEIDQLRWQRWLTHDPVLMVASCVEALKSLRGVYIDCGSRDQYNIQYGTRRLIAELNRHQIKHHYEEFDGTHSNIDYRLDSSLAFLSGIL